MNETLRERIARDRRGIISSLWVVFFLNMLFRDIHEIVRPGAIDEYQERVVSEGTFLAAGIALSVFISMIVLTRVLPDRRARIGNLMVPVLALLGMTQGEVNDLDDAWFLAVEVVALAAIVAIAWSWRPSIVLPEDVEVEPRRASV